MNPKRNVAFGLLAALVVPVILSSCGGDEDGGTDPVLVTQVSVTPPAPSVQAGQTVQLSATPRSASGGALNRAVTWSSGNAAVASVSQTGLVTGVEAGSTQITATSEGVEGGVTVTVTPRPVASVVVQPDSIDILVGGTTDLTATPLDADDDPLTGRVVTWSSENETIATVSATGVVTGEGEGVVTITATSEGVSGVARVVVAEPSPVGIDSIAPALLVEGETATLFGFGFAPTPAGNGVTVDGASATVLTASATSLEITVPATGCRPTRDAPIRVAVGTAQSPIVDHPLRPAAFLDMQLGEQVIVQATGPLCLQFDAAAGAEAYLVGVQSTSASVSSVTPAELVGRAGGGSPPLPLATMLPEPAAARAGVQPPDARASRLNAHRSAEARLRDAERPLLERLVAARDRRAAAPPSAIAAVPPDVQVGDTVQLSVIDVNAADLCSDFAVVDAEVRVIGTNGVWLTDVTNPAGGYSDLDLQTMSDLFDDVIYGTDVAYFGEPTDLDGNERIAILTTRRVNATPGLLGFVFSGDLFPVADCASSNVAEVYYGIAPDPNGDFGSAYSLEDALLDAPGLIAHEFTHILQRGNAGHAQAVWEAEGQAVFGEEVVGFASQGRAPGNDYGIDVALNQAGTDPISWYVAHFTVLASYFGWPGNSGTQIVGAPEQCSWLGRPPNGPCTNDQRMVYDVAKSLLRYVSDQFGPGYPGGEQGLHRDLISLPQSGFDLIEEVTGLPIETVLARWAASLYVDNRYLGMDPTLTWSTWDLFDISDGLIDSAQLHPRPRGFANFSDEFSVRGGSSAYFTISGAGRPATAVEAVSQSGASLPAFMQVWVVRVE